MVLLCHHIKATASDKNQRQQELRAKYEKCSRNLDFSPALKPVPLPAQGITDDFHEDPMKVCQ
jgi:hypothetical protein